MRRRRRRETTRMYCGGEVLDARERPADRLGRLRVRHQGNGRIEHRLVEPGEGGVVPEGVAIAEGLLVRRELQVLEVLLDDSPG